jgi:hypothetical protein
MLARILLRQVSLAARAPMRGYTSSIKEGSVASSKEFGCVLAVLPSGPSEAILTILCTFFVARRRKHMKACLQINDCHERGGSLTFGYRPIHKAGRT